MVKSISGGFNTVQSEDYDTDEAVVESQVTEETPLKFQNKSALIRKMILSFVIILSVAFAWTGAIQFSKTALVIDTKHFYAPFCMSWFSTNFMLLCYPVYMLYIIISKGLNNETVSKYHEEARQVYGEKFFSYKNYFLKTALFLFLWVGANYSYTQALVHIAASVATSISSANTAMVCILAWFFLKDKFNLYQVTSIGCAIAGVIVISQDKSAMKQDNHTVGIILAIVSACFSATYKVLFKRIIGNATLGQVSMFMTGLGVMNLCINIIPASILLYTGQEIIDTDYVPWGPIAGSSLLNLTFNFLVNFGIALLHPLVISIGMLLGIPLNAVADILFRNIQITNDFIIGGSLIFLSFTLIVLPFDLFIKKHFKCKVFRSKA
uniref:EamA domain-containing protein n=1 Tax=Rhabditophanes sp. KR3021 TaxID=114890 RepID=A0AC35TN02_9BILA